jgi:hypothetical protein
LRIEAINERMKPYAYKMEMRLYLIRQDLLNRRINNQLITSEAEKRKVGSEEIFRVESPTKSSHRPMLKLRSSTTRTNQKSTAT